MFYELLKPTPPSNHNHEATPRVGVFSQRISPASKRALSPSGSTTATRRSTPDVPTRRCPERPLRRGTARKARRWTLLLYAVRRHGVAAGAPNTTSGLRAEVLFLQKPTRPCFRRWRPLRPSPVALKVLALSFKESFGESERWGRACEHAPKEHHRNTGPAPTRGLGVRALRVPRPSIHMPPSYECAERPREGSGALVERPI